MLVGDLKKDFVRQNETSGLWAVRYGCPQWAGWVNWYWHEIGKRFFVEWLTVPTEWPPTTPEQARGAAKWLSDIRDGKYLKEPGLVSDIPVPSDPAPWDGSKVIPKPIYDQFEGDRQ